MKLRVTALAIVSALCVGSACRHRWEDGPHVSPRLELEAQRAAKRSASFDLDCTRATATTVSVADGGDTMFYRVDVAGCDRQAIFAVTCRHGICTAERESGG